MKITLTIEDLPEGSTDVGTEFDPLLGDQTPNTTSFLFCLIAHQAIRQFQAGEYNLEEDAALTGSWLHFQKPSGVADGKSG